jgi:hypothetical protein
MTITTDNTNYLNYQILFEITGNELLINFSNRFALELQKHETKKDRFKADSRRLVEYLADNINNANLDQELVIKRAFQNLMKTPENRIFSALVQAMTKNIAYNPELFLNPENELKTFDYELPNLYFEKSLIQGTEGTIATIIVTRNGNVNQLNTTTTVEYNSFGYGDFPSNNDDFAPNTLPTGILSFAPQETQKEIQINLASTNPAEPTETFQVILSNATNANLFRRQCVVQIINVP